jgi:hypothetical protein
MPGDIQYRKRLVGTDEKCIEEEIRKMQRKINVLLEGLALFHGTEKRTVKYTLKKLIAGSLPFFVLAITIFVYTNDTFAFQVSELPEGNLIKNPWFRNATKPSLSGLDDWIDAAGLDETWSSSQKPSNPAHEIIVSGVCGNQEIYCGTAARLSDKPGQSGGTVNLGEDAYLYQVVQADPKHTKLKFFAHWVSHAVAPAEIEIYGGDSPNGPWSFLWEPFYHEQSELIYPPGGNTEFLWEDTSMLEHTLSDGYSHYKIQIHARLPVSDVRGGFKITGVYFTTETGQPEPSETPPPSVTPLPTRTDQPTTTPEPSPTIGSMEDIVFVGDLDGDAIDKTGSYWAAIVNVQIKNDKGGVLTDALVNGFWSIGTNTISDSCLTNNGGICEISLRRIEQNQGSVIFMVTNVTHSFGPYDPGANVDPDGDSNGTTLQIVSP